MTKEIEKLEDYKIIFEKHMSNIQHSKLILGGGLLGFALFTPLAALGASYLLIAAGGALGAVQGAILSDNYFGKIRDFEIVKVNSGTGANVIFINGFLQEKIALSNDWQNAVAEFYGNNPQYLIRWESKVLADIGSIIAKELGRGTAKKLLLKYSAKNIASKLNPLSWGLLAADLIGNPWHSAVVKAAMTGAVVADLLSRTKQSEGFVLMGHSLGCRVIYYILEALSALDRPIIKDVYLLGGGVSRTDVDGWARAARAVSGKIYNCYSDNDLIMKGVYRVGSALLSDPIGAGPIVVHDDFKHKIENVNVSAIVDGHMDYKLKFNIILNSIFHDNDMSSSFVNVA